ncbi:MAG: hypothetical protein OT477_10260 [Chloroflexi bacterium]|nr:hypothetical protein [Chloroflexota bacterium]
MIREKLHHQIDTLPEDVVELIADFTLFIMSRRKMTPLYEDWSDIEWQDFAMQQFFRDVETEDEVEYFLEDAREVYHP